MNYISPIYNRPIIYMYIICMHLFIYLFIHSFTHMCTIGPMFVSMHVCAYASVYVCLLVRVCVRTCVPTYIYACMRIRCLVVRSVSWMLRMQLIPIHHWPQSVVRPDPSSGRLTFDPGVSEWTGPRSTSFILRDAVF